MIGTTLAHYRITAALGAGGMGEVWRATDEKLGREVALKVLPADFAADPERLARFEREAKVLASLNHPNIAHLYGLETVNTQMAAGTAAPSGSADGFAGTSNAEPVRAEPEGRSPMGHASRVPDTDAAREPLAPQGSRAAGEGLVGQASRLPDTDAGFTTFLVMELVEGEDLSERIARGPIPIDEAIPIARQIAEAFEAAHEAGIVHRDLKPANIKLTENGTVKVLDFGLAKAWETESGNSSLSLSPTVTRHSTVEGVILGTAAYMSPEQARGKKVDRRADIWSFGVVLWELLTGRRLFEGETASDILAGVLKDDPNWDDLPQGTPPSIRRLLRRCLERELRRRQQHFGDARLELDDGLAEAEHPPAKIHPGPGMSSPKLKTFKLTTEVCRTLDRESLDPAIIGDHLEYLDNEKSSDTLVLYLAGFGQEHATFSDVLMRSPHRGIAVTLFGFEGSRGHRIPLPMAAHLKVLKALLESLLQTIRPARTILTGFSSGADVAQRLVAEAGVDRSHIDGILALGPNLDLNTCFITARVAEIPDGRPDEIFEVTKNLMAGADSAGAWLRMSPYLSEVMRKFDEDVNALRVHGHDLVAPFAESGNRAAADWYRVAKSLKIAVRLVFASTEDEQDPLRKLLLSHVENGMLGPDFSDTDIATEPDSDHFTLMNSEVIEKHLDSLLLEVGASRTEMKG